MIPKTLTLRQFKCFTETLTFQFPTSAGLYLVQGRNEVQTALEGNGCGKSTLFCDALTWCLFGKTPRLLKAGDILNWESASPASVAFEFELNGEVYSVLRTQAPNSLCLDVAGERKVISQDQLNDLIKLDFDAFVSSVVFAQFGQMFFDLSPADKSTLLSNVLDLSVWDKATDQAKKSLSQLESSVLAVKERVAHAKGQITGLLSQDYSKQIQDWEEKQDEKRQELSDSLEVFNKNIEKIKKKGKKVEEELAKSDEIYKELALMRADALNLVDSIKEELNNFKGFEVGQRKDLEFYERELKKFKNVANTCPYCKQVVSKTHLEGEISALQAEIQTVLDKITSNKQQISAKLLELDAANEDAAAIEAEKAQLDSENRVFVDEKQNLKVELSKILGSVAQINKELEKLGQAKNPFVAEQQKQQESIKILQEKVELDQKELEKLDKDVFSTSFWVKAFKDVRLSMISDVLTQLELEVNNKLFQLGLHDWKVDFAVEGLTKGGKIRKGFTVTISTPQNLEPVPWSAWSGGETQRLRLAGALGMADLIVSRSGIYPEFEVLDEPSQYLSAAGIESLLDILRDRAKTTNKRIFLIDHRNLDATAFDGIFTIVKTDEGVVIES